MVIGALLGSAIPALFGKPGYLTTMQQKLVRTTDELERTRLNATVAHQQLAENNRNRQDLLTNLEKLKTKNEEQDRNGSRHTIMSGLAGLALGVGGKTLAQRRFRRKPATKEDASIEVQASLPQLSVSESQDSPTNREAQRSRSPALSSIASTRTVSPNPSSANLGGSSDSDTHDSPKNGEAQRSRSPAPSSSSSTRTVSPESWPANRGDSSGSDTHDSRRQRAASIGRSPATSSIGSTRTFSSEPSSTNRGGSSGSASSSSTDVRIENMRPEENVSASSQRGSASSTPNGVSVKGASKGNGKGGPPPEPHPKAKARAQPAKATSSRLLGKEIYERLLRTRQRLSSRPSSQESGKKRRASSIVVDVDNDTNDIIDKIEGDIKVDDVVRENDEVTLKNVLNFLAPATYNLLLRACDPKMAVEESWKSAIKCLLGQENNDASFAKNYHQGSVKIFDDDNNKSGKALKAVPTKIMNTSDDVKGLLTFLLESPLWNSIETKLSKNTTWTEGETYSVTASADQKCHRFNMDTDYPRYPTEEEAIKVLVKETEDSLSTLSRKLVEDKKKQKSAPPKEVSKSKSIQKADYREEVLFFWKPKLNFSEKQKVALWLTQLGTAKHDMSAAVEILKSEGPARKASLYRCIVHTIADNRQGSHSNADPFQRIRTWLDLCTLLLQENAYKPLEIDLNAKLLLRDKNVAHDKNLLILSTCMEAVTTIDDYMQRRVDEHQEVPHDVNAILHSCAVVFDVVLRMHEGAKIAKLWEDHGE